MTRSGGERRHTPTRKAKPHGQGWVNGAAAALAVLSVRSSARGAAAPWVGEAVDG